MTSQEQQTHAMEHLPVVRAPGTPYGWNTKDLGAEEECWALALMLDRKKYCPGYRALSEKNNSAICLASAMVLIFT
jgi:hypothetical protein